MTKEDIIGNDATTERQLIGGSLTEAKSPGDFILREPQINSYSGIRQFVTKFPDDTRCCRPQNGLIRSYSNTEIPRRFEQEIKVGEVRPFECQLR